MGISLPLVDTGDSPPTPFLTMGQERIFKRLLAKEILRKAFTTIPTNVNNDEDKPSVHGEFGNIGDVQVNWRSNKTQIANWINTNRPQVEATVEALITPELRPQRNEFVNWVCDTSRVTVRETSFTPVKTFSKREFSGMGLLGITFEAIRND